MIISSDVRGIASLIVLITSGSTNTQIFRVEDYTIILYLN